MCLANVSSPHARQSTACISASASISSSPMRRRSSGAVELGGQLARDHVPVEELHDVEGHAEHGLVVARGEHARRAHVCVLDRAQHARLAQHVVGAAAGAAGAAAGAARSSRRRGPHGRSRSSGPRPRARPRSAPIRGPAQSRNSSSGRRTISGGRSCAAASSGVSTISGEAIAGPHPIGVQSRGCLASLSWPCSCWRFRRARPAAPQSVSIADFAFTPGTVTVNAGEAVTWTFTGPDTNHSVTSSPPVRQSRSIRTPARFPTRPTTPWAAGTRTPSRSPGATRTSARCTPHAGHREGEQRRRFHRQRQPGDHEGARATGPPQLPRGRAHRHRGAGEAPGRRGAC